MLWFDPAAGSWATADYSHVPVDACQSNWSGSAKFRGAWAGGSTLGCRALLCRGAA